MDEVTEYLKSRGVSRLDAAYGCSMGGACLTRMLALGKIPISRAIIDGGITPYQLPFLVRKLLLARDVLSFKMAANSRKISGSGLSAGTVYPLQGTTPKNGVRCHGSLSQNLFRSDDPQYILVRQQLRASEVPRKIPARSSPTGTAMTKRGTAGATFNSSSAISRRHAFTAFRKWHTRSW